MRTIPMTKTKTCRRATIAGLSLAVTALSAVISSSGVSGPARARAEATVTVKNVVSGKCLTDNGPYTAVIGACDGSDRQRWIVDASPTTIKNVASGKCLTANATATGACEGSDQERWIMGSSPTTIQNVASGKCLAQYSTSSHSANSSPRGDNSDGQQSSDGNDTVGLGACEDSDKARWITG